MHDGESSYFLDSRPNRSDHPPISNPWGVLRDSKYGDPFECVGWACCFINYSQGHPINYEIICKSIRHIMFHNGKKTQEIYVRRVAKLEDERRNGNEYPWISPQPCLELIVPTLHPVIQLLTV